MNFAAAVGGLAEGGQLDLACMLEEIVLDSISPLDALSITRYVFVMLFMHLNLIS